MTKVFNTTISLILALTLVTGATPEVCAEGRGTRDEGRGAMGAKVSSFILHPSSIISAGTTRATLTAPLASGRAQDEAILASLGFVVRDVEQGLIGYGDIYQVPHLSYALHMIAHGTTQNNKERRFHGCRTDNEKSVLSLDGEMETRRGASEWWDAYGEDFMRDPGAYVFVRSPARRAGQTFDMYRELIKERSGIDIAQLNPAVTVDEALREIDFGNWDGKTEEEIAAMTDTGAAEYARAKIYRRNNALMYSSHDGVHRDGESYLRMMKRVYDWMRAGNERFTGKKVFAFGHGTFLNAADTLMKNERVAILDDSIRYESHVMRRGCAEYIGGNDTELIETLAPVIATVPTRQTQIRDVTRISAHTAELYRQDIEQFVNNLRRVHEAYERAVTAGEREHTMQLKSELIQALTAYCARMPRFNDGGETTALLREARDRYPVLYREIVAANNLNDTAALVKRNAEALGLNYTIMRLSIVRATELLTGTSNWMASVLLLESAMHRAEQLKAEIFFRDFRNKVRTRTDDERSAVSQFVRTLNLGELAISMRAGDQKPVIVKRVGWKVVAARLAEVKKALAANTALGANARDGFSTMLVQLSEQYRPDGAPEARDLIARAFLQVRAFLTQMPLTAEAKKAATDLVVQLIDIVGDEKVKLAVPVAFGDEFTRIKSEFDIIVSAEQDIDVLNARNATVSFLIERLKEPRVLSVDEQAFFSDALADCAAWLERGIVPEKGSSEKKVREAQRIIDAGPITPALMERVRGFLEGTKQDPGISRLLEIRIREVRTKTIRNAEKRLYEAYRDWSDNDVLSVLNEVKRIAYTNLTAANRAMSTIEEICVSGPRALFYTAIRPQIEELRRVIERMDRREGRKIDALIMKIELTLEQTRTVVPQMPAETNETAVITAA